MPRKTLVLGAALLVVLVPALSGQSAASPSPGLEADLGEETESYGFDTQYFWVPGSKAAWFFGPYGVSSLGYWGSGPISAFFEAPVELPAGALVTQITCYFHETTGGSASVRLIKNRFNTLDNTTSIEQVGPTITASGTGYHTNAAAFNETIRYRAGDFLDYYTLTGGTNFNRRLRGCRIDWNRQVTPAPASATFADVPTTHPFFRFVEALAASGITAGCAPSTYCVDAPITRGEMAVFLAVALGLHFPY
jgi:hypothetical protein